MEILPTKTIPQSIRLLHQWYIPNIQWINFPNIIKLCPDNREGTLPDSFYETSITLIPKLDKEDIRKENYRPLTHFL